MLLYFCEPFKDVCSKNVLKWFRKQWHHKTVKYYKSEIQYGALGIIL